MRSLVWRVLPMMLVCGTAWAGDVGLAAGVQAPVELRAEGRGPKLSVVAYSRVREADQFHLGPGASLELVYFDGGRRETWTGPCTLVVRQAGAEPSGCGASLTQEALGAQAGDGLRQVQLTLTRAEQERGGTTLVRGDTGTAPALDAAELAEVEAARAELDRRASVDREPDDIVAELAFAGVLLRYSLTEEARGVLLRADARCGGCVATSALLAALPLPQGP